MNPGLKFLAKSLVLPSTASTSATLESELLRETAFMKLVLYLLA